MTVNESMFLQLTGVINYDNYEHHLEESYTFVRYINFMKIRAMTGELRSAKQKVQATSTNILMTTVLSYFVKPHQISS